MKNKENQSILTLIGAKKQGLYVANVIVEKCEWEGVKNFIKANEYTLAKVVYTKGQYLATVIFEKVRQTTLMYAGYKKWNKVQKDKFISCISQVGKEIPFASMRA